VRGEAARASGLERHVGATLADAQLCVAQL